MSPKKVWYNRDGFISISHRRVVCRIIRRRSAFNRLFRPILKTFQGIYKSSVKADPNRIIFSSGVFGISWKVVDATAKFLKSIKLTTLRQEQYYVLNSHIFLRYAGPISLRYNSSTCADLHVTPLNYSYSETPADVLTCVNLQKRICALKQRILLLHLLQIWITKTMFVKSYVSCIKVHHLRSGGIFLRLANKLTKKGRTTLWSQVNMNMTESIYCKL